jgi:alcohol dehydrogenase class IV
MAELARVAGVPDAAGMGEAAAAAAFVDWLTGLKATVGVPAQLSGLAGTRRVTAADVPALVAIATKDLCHQTNPRPCTAGDFEHLFAAAL